MIFAGQQETAEFVAASCGLDRMPWVQWTAIGVKDAHGLAGGVVFTDYNGRDIEAHIAIRPKSRGAIVIRYGFKYAFSQLQCRRISVTIEADNVKSRRICERLGFVQEGIKRQAGRLGQDCLIYGLLKHEITHRPDRP